MDEITFGEFTQNTIDDKIAKLKEQVQKIIIGQEQNVELLLTAVIANGHVLIEGVPGVAKTLSARLLAKLINADFSRIQFTSDIMPSDILGTNVYNMSSNSFDFHKGPVFGDIVLVDEINRAPAKTQSALFEVMEEKQATIDGKVYPLSNIYTIIATQNPIEQAGTYRLPEAQMDRFMFKISVGYPSLEDEMKILEGHNTNQEYTKLNGIDPILSIADILELREKASKIHANANAIKYITKIVQQSRSHKSVYIGASPRATIALLAASKAYALIQGRDYIIPDDIKMLAIPVMQHRISLTAEAEMEGISIQQVIGEIVNSVNVPK